MIFPTISPFNSRIWPGFKLGKNEWSLLVDFSNLYTVVSPIKSLILNIIEILDSIQAETNKYSAVVDLANIFCSVSISTDSQLHFALSSKKYNALLGIECTLEYLNIPAISYNLYRKEFNPILLPPGA